MADPIPETSSLIRTDSDRVSQVAQRPIHVSLQLQAGQYACARVLRDVGLEGKLVPVIALGLYMLTPKDIPLSYFGRCWVSRDVKGCT